MLTDLHTSPLHRGMTAVQVQMSLAYLAVSLSGKISAPWAWYIKLSTGACRAGTGLSSLALRHCATRCPCMYAAPGSHILCGQPSPAAHTRARHQPL